MVDISKMAWNELNILTGDPNVSPEWRSLLMKAVAEGNSLVLNPTERKLLIGEMTNARP